MMQGMDHCVHVVLLFPQEAAARDVARELADAGCRYVAVRTRSTSSPWEVSSLAVYPVPGADPEQLSSLIQHERRELAALARSRGGALFTHLSYSPSGIPTFSDGALVHKDAAALKALPDLMPEERPRPPSAPEWQGLDFGDPATEIREAVAVAKRMYGTNEAPPPTLEFLIHDAFAKEIEDSYESTREFLGDLVEMAHHMGGGEDLVVPYLAELTRSEALSPGARTSLLLVLLGFASQLDHVIAGHADLSALGIRVDVRYVTCLRDAVVAQTPGLLPQWDRESGAARYVLASLAVFCPQQTASLVLPRLADVPAPQGTDRADVLALAAALLEEDAQAIEAAVHRVAVWDSDLAEQLDSPHTPRPQAARAALEACVRRDLPGAVRVP